jgi:ATP-dependent protease HslVU (ClpYQ) peptidase subunit
MTCIVGYVEDGKVYMAADSAASDGESVCVRRDTKLFNLRNMLFGFCGSYRVGQVLRYTPEMPRQLKSQTDHQFLCTDFVDFLIELLESSRTLANEGGLASLGLSNLLLGYKGMLYHIDSDMQVGVESTPYCSIGSGFQFATGAMHAMTGVDLPPKERLTKAVMAAADNAIGVKPPILVVTLNGRSCLKFL